MNALDNGDGIKHGLRQHGGHQDAGGAHQHMGHHSRQLQPLGQTHKTIISVQQNSAQSQAKESFAGKGPSAFTGTATSHMGPAALGGASLGKRNAFMSPQIG